MKIAPPQKLDVAVNEIASQISRPVQPCLRSVRKRIGNKPFRSHFGPIQISAGNSISAYINLSLNVHRSNLLASIERNRRRLRIEDLLLLIVRCAIVGLIALVVARPVLRSASASLLGRSSVTAVVDRVPYAKPALPVPGPAGSSFLDPVFQSAIHRLMEIHDHYHTRFDGNTEQSYVSHPDSDAEVVAKQPLQQ